MRDIGSRPPAPNPPEGAVSRAFAVFETLALSDDPIRLSKIATELGMQKSTVHRILATLSELGYAQQERQSGCYRATLRLWELGSGVVSRHPVKRAAAGFLQRLHLTTGETVSLTILSGTDVLYLDKLVSPRPIRFTSRIGSRVPAVLTAGGKAILAHQPDGRDLVRQACARLSGTHAVSVDAVLRQLDAVLKKGYATSSFRAGVVSFAAPIMAQQGRADAALSVSAPETRLDRAKRQSIVEHLLGTCADIADRVGDL